MSGDQKPGLEAAALVARFARAFLEFGAPSDAVAESARAFSLLISADEFAYCHREAPGGGCVIASLCAGAGAGAPVHHRNSDAFWRRLAGGAVVDLALEADLPAWLARLGRAFAVVSELRDRDASLGWVALFFREGRAVPEGCTDALSALADVAARAMAERAFRAVHEVRDALAADLASPAQADEKNRHIAGALGRLIDFDRAGMVVRDRAAGMFRVGFVAGLRVPSLDDWSGALPPSVELTKRLAATRRGAIMHFEPTGTGLDAAFEAGLRSGIAWPVLKGDEFLAILFVASKADAVYRESDIDRIAPIVSAVAEWVAVVQEEAHHRDVQRRFGDLYDNAPDPYQTLDATGRVLDVNLAAIDVLGRAREAVLGNAFRDLLSEETRTAFDEAFARLKKAGQIANIDLTVQRPDGTRREVVWNSTAAHGPDGAFAYSRDTMRDVTHLRRLWRERSIRSAVVSSLIRARSVRDVAQNALRGLVDGHEIVGGRIDLWDAASSTLRWCGGVGLTGWKIDPGASVPLNDHVAREAILRRETVRVQLGTAEARVTDPALHEVLGTLLCFPLVMRGQMLGVLSLVHPRTGVPVDEDVRVLGAVAGDVSVVFDNARLYDDLDETNRRLMRRQREEVHREKLAAVGQLAAGIAHEINNPLMFILGNINLLQEQLDESLVALKAYRDAVQDPGDRARLAELEHGLGTGLGPDGTDSDARRLIADVLEGVRRIRDVVATLLRFAKGSPEEAIMCDLHLLIRRGMAVVHNEVAHRATVVTKFGDVPLVRCVPGNVEQAVVNLLLNAAQAIPHGRAGKNTVTIETWCEHGRANLRISDTGCGIPAAILARVAEPFFTTKPIGEGTGLGLTLVHEIARNMGGEVRIESEEGKGTSVTLLLPVPTRAERVVEFPVVDTPVVGIPMPPRPEAIGTMMPRGPAVPPKIPAVTASTPIAPRRHRILIIDDEELTLKLLSRIFGKTYDLLVAASGAQALSLLDVEAARPPDFILCDLMMPDLTGMAFFAEVEMRYPVLVDRTFFLTGGAFTDEARAFVERMGSRVFFKPLEVQQIRQLLENELNKRHKGATA